MIIKTFVVIENNDRYLLIQEAGIKWRGKWFLPGGSLKRGEDPGEAVKRETEEEAGCKVKLHGIFYIKCYAGILRSKLHIFYSGTAESEKVKTYEDKHSMKAQWFSYDEIRQLPLRQKMMKILERHRKSRSAMSSKNFKLMYFKPTLKRLI